DEGWQAAEALRRSSSADVTAAGLPKRRPRQQLVPGAAGSSPPAAESGQSEPRHAETVRDRLAGYQRGLRHGRDARRDYPEQDGTTEGHGDEDTM
ncbi:MAG: hypothetical protein ACRDRZ_09295, partial [Pseudonocardiaceae bacterium]